MQRRLTKKLSNALKENGADQRQITGRSKKMEHQVLRNHRQQLAEEEDENYEFEDQGYDDRSKGRETSSRDRSPRQLENFNNSRLGAAFVPALFPDLNPPRRKTPSPMDRLGSKFTGYFGSRKTSNGFVPEDLDDQDDDDLIDEEPIVDSRIAKGRLELEDDDDDEYEDVDDEEIEDTNDRSRRSQTIHRTSSKTTSGKKLSKDRLNNSKMPSKGKTASNSGLVSLKKQSTTNLGSSSKDRLNRKSSLKKVSIDELRSADSVNSMNSFVTPPGFTSSSRVPTHASYAVGRRGSAVSSASSREVMALPIEIPDTVTDEDAFRRYLSVRRGANTDMRPHIAFEDNQTSYESVGVGGPSRVPASMGLNGKYAAIMSAETSKRTMSLSYSIMTLALLSASASQLRFLVAYSKAHSYPLLNYFLICLCIVIEIIVGVGYLILSRFNFTDSRAETVQSYLIAGLFIVAVANVIIAAFAFDDHVCEQLAKQTEMFDTVDQSSS